MIRFITRRRLTALEGDLENARMELHRVRLAAQSVLAQKHLAEQARDHYKEQLDYWKPRAERFLDQAQLKAGTIDSPVMGEATPPAASTMRGLMSALNKQVINKTPAEPVPPAAAILGVDERAARAAVADVLHS